MKNYITYFFAMAVIAILLVMIIATSISSGQASRLWPSIWLLLPLGVAQLFVGAYLLSKRRAYPRWIQVGIRNYWLMSIGYFPVLIGLLSWLPLDGLAFYVWLAIVPWGIATYQFVLVFRMAALRDRQLEKRQFLQLYKH